MAKVSHEVRKEYKRILHRSRVDKSESFVGNRYPWQCQAAVHELLSFGIDRQSKRAANEPVEILILTGSLPDYVFGVDHSCTEFEDFLNAGGRVRVLVWAKEIQPGARKLIEHNKHLSALQVRVSGTDNRGESLSHFLVVDKTAYRLERPHPKVPPQAFDDFTPEIPAKITFNDPTFATELATFFDDIWNRMT